MTTISKELKDGKEIIILGGELTIAHAKSIRDALAEAVKKAREVHVMFQDVQEVDVSFFQILCSAHLTAENMHKSLTIGELNNGIIGRALEQFGFMRHVGCRSACVSPCLWLCATSSDKGHAVGSIKL